jgi:hypothetical protein
MHCVVREVRPEYLFSRLILLDIQQHLLDLTHSLNIFNCTKFYLLYNVYVIVYNNVFNHTQLTLY